MKLYYSPGSSSLAAHIIALEAGLDFEPCRVDLMKKQTEDGTALSWLHPKACVPLLEFAPGEVLPVSGVRCTTSLVLSEDAAILQLLADSKAELGLNAPAGSIEYYRIQEWLAYIAIRLQKGFSLLSERSMAEPATDEVRSKLMQELSYVAKHLCGRTYLVGSTFTIADAYLYAVLSSAGPAGAGMPMVVAKYLERIAERAAVAAAAAAQRQCRRSSSGA